MNESSASRIGIDLGGTKTEIVVLEPAGTICYRQRLPTPGGNYDATLQVIADLVLQATAACGLAADLPVGIGTPGTVSRKTGMMKNCNSTALNGKPLIDDLQSLLQRPVRIANDADCFALSEASDGAGADYTSVFGVILGTGAGGGLVYQRQLLQGVNGISGEWGHNTLPTQAFCADPDDLLPAPAASPRDCYCGRRDCIEQWVCGPGFERSYTLLTGESVKAEVISARHQAGQTEATATLRNYANLLALSLATVINIVDPDCIVLGGGLSNIQALYRLLPDYLPNYVFSDQVDTRIVPAKFGDSSGVRGAAWLWPGAPV